jgi:hypothetical protein
VPSSGRLRPGSGTANLMVKVDASPRRGFLGARVNLGEARS